MNNLLTSVQRLEEARGRLHEALREASFQFALAQREEEQRGHSLDLTAIPTAPATLRPVVTCAVLEPVSVSSQNDLALTMEATYPTLKLEVAACKDDAKGAALCGRDNPIMCFSASPSYELRDCQHRFQTVLHHVVVVANAQVEVLALSATVARTK